MQKVASLLSLLSVLLFGISAQAAATETLDSSFKEAIAALDRGALDEAIDRFENLSDRGLVHPDASYDRAVAYVERSRTPRAKPGDLGRAAAALSETLALRPNDEQAEAALDKVRAEIARRRTREGVGPMSAKVSLARAVVGLVSEQIWGALAVLGCVLVTFGIALRSAKRTPASELASALGVGIGLVLLLTCAGLTAAARHFRLTSRHAVVVVPEARLLDASGKAVVQKQGVPEFTSLPEGASVYVKEQEAGLSRVEWGTVEGFVTTSQIRVLAVP
jgi:hypothetical protein